MTTQKPAKALADLKQQILSYLKTHPGTSFVELQWEFNDAGDQRLELRPNLVLWNGMSVELSEAIRQLANAGKVEVCPCSPFVYFHDGRYLPLPLAKKPPAKGYKTPRWLPVVFNPVTRK